MIQTKMAISLWWWYIRAVACINIESVLPVRACRWRDSWEGAVREESDWWSHHITAHGESRNQPVTDLWDSAGVVCISFSSVILSDVCLTCSVVYDFSHGWVRPKEQSSVIVAMAGLDQKSPLDAPLETIFHVPHVGFLPSVRQENWVLPTE